MTVIPVSFSANNGYIDLPVTTDPNALIQQAIAAIQAELPGWIPVEGHIEMLLLEQFAAMTAASAQVAASMPIAAFEYFGQLVGINPIAAGPATALTSWTMVDAQGYSVPAGTVLAYQVLGNNLILFSTVEPFSTVAASPGRLIVAGHVTSGSAVLLDPADSFTQADVNKPVSDGGVSIPRTTVSAGSTTVASGSNGGVLSNIATWSNPSNGVLDVTAVTNFPNAGTAFVLTSAGYQQIAYTGQGVGQLTGCTFLSGTAGATVVTTNPVIEALQAPTGTINVGSTTGFAGAGSVIINTNVGTPASPVIQPQLITYTGTTSTSFTGCTGGTGYIWNGYVVQPYILSVQNSGQATMSANASTNEASEGVTLGAVLGTQTATGVEIQAQTAGALGNNLPTGPLTLVTSLSYVASVESTTVSSGGTQAETIEQYINRLSDELQLLTPRPILPSDYAALAASIPGVARAVAYNNTYGGATFPGNLSSGSPTVTAGPATTVSSASNTNVLPQAVINVASTTNFPSVGTFLINTSDGFVEVSYTGVTGTAFTGCSGGAGEILTGDVVSGSLFLFTPFMVGLSITGTAIPGSSTIITYDNPVQVTMNHNAANDETYETITLPDNTNIERAVAVTAVDAEGQPVAASVVNNIVSNLEALREVNFMVSYIQPSYLDLYVTYVAILDPHSEASVITGAINAAVTSYLSPANWAGGNQVPPTWDVTLDTVFYLSLASVIESVPGVQSIQVVAGTPSLGIGTSPNPSYGYADVSLAASLGVYLPNLISVSGAVLPGS